MDPTKLDKFVRIKPVWVVQGKVYLSPNSSSSKAAAAQNVPNDVSIQRPETDVSTESRTSVIRHTKEYEEKLNIGHLNT